MEKDGESENGIVGDGMKKSVLPMFVVHAAAIVLKAVGHDKVIHMEQHVVDGNLVEYTLRKFNIGCLVFDNHLRFECLIK